MVCIDGDSLASIEDVEPRSMGLSLQYTEGFIIYMNNDERHGRV